MVYYRKSIGQDPTITWSLYHEWKNVKQYRMKSTKKQKTVCRRKKLLQSWFSISDSAPTISWWKMNIQPFLWLSFVWQRTKELIYEKHFQNWKSWYKLLLNRMTPLESHELKNIFLLPPCSLKVYVGQQHFTLVYNQILISKKALWFPRSYFESVYSNPISVFEGILGKYVE